MFLWGMNPHNLWNRAIIITPMLHQTLEIVTTDAHKYSHAPPSRHRVSQEQRRTRLVKETCEGQSVSIPAPKNAHVSSMFLSQSLNGHRSFHQDDVSMGLSPRVTIVSKGPQRLTWTCRVAVKKIVFVVELLRFWTCLLLQLFLIVY